MKQNGIKSPEEIHELIEQHHYNDALRRVSEVLKQNHFALDTKEGYDLYTDYLQLRVTINGIIQQRDEAIRELAYKERNPHIYSIELGNDRRIKLIDKSIVRFICDAAVNSYHTEKLFDYSDISFSKEFLDRLGHDHIEQEYERQKSNPEGFFTLTHPQFTFPTSYHIPAYYGNNKVDLELLRSGIGSVMKEVISKRLKTIAFAPVGMSLNGNSEEKAEVILTIGESISNALMEEEGGKKIEVYVAFSQFELFSDFKRMFKSMTNYGHYLKDVKKELERIQSQLVHHTRAADDRFIGLLNRISCVVNEDTHILFLGESGVGKSTLARNIHLLGRRKNLKFRSLNCASTNPQDLYLQVFGYTKDTLTGMTGPKKSIFEVAEGGTVFLDEIESASLFFQRALLRFLESGKFMKLGEEAPTEIEDVRVIFGANQNLEELVARKQFEVGLYECIASNRVFELPPLRKRPNDIPAFAAAELIKLNYVRRKRLKKDNKQEDEDCDIKFSDEALECLRGFRWPGNVRQLNFYVQNLFYDTIYAQRVTISSEAILANPPRDTSIKGDIASLIEASLFSLIANWDHERHGKIKDDFLLPILAKVFLDDFGSRFTKQDAMLVLGMTANKKDSYLDQMYAKYENARSMKL